MFFKYAEEDLIQKTIDYGDCKVNEIMTKAKDVIHIKATDSIDRVSTFRAIYYVTNTSVVKVDEPKIVFDDSTISEDGSINVLETLKNQYNIL